MRKACSHDDSAGLGGARQQVGEPQLQLYSPNLAEVVEMRRAGEQQLWQLDSSSLAGAAEMRQMGGQQL